MSTYSIDGISNNQSYTAKSAIKDKKTEFSKTLDNYQQSSTKQDGIDLAHKKLAQEFVAEIYSEIWKLMESDREVDPLFGGGFAEELWKSELTASRIHKALDDVSTPLSQAVCRSLKRKRNELDAQQSTGQISE